MDKDVTQLYVPGTLIMPSFSWEWCGGNKNTTRFSTFIKHGPQKVLYFTDSSFIST